MRKELTDAERQVMEAILRGGHPTLPTLRDQLAVAEVAQRDSSDVGFFTTFNVPPTAPRPLDARNALVDDAFAMVEGLEYPAGFILYVRDGVLDILEGYTFGEDRWPGDAKVIRVFYMRPEYGGRGALVETDDRDFRWLER